MDLYSESAPFDGTQECLKIDPEWFFPEDYDDRFHVLVAKSACKRCPLATACLEYAVKDPSLDGIWGGTTPRERKNMRRRRKVLV